MTPTKGSEKREEKRIRKMERRFQRTRDAIKAGISQSPTDILTDPLKRIGVIAAVPQMLEKWRVDEQVDQWMCCCLL
jgi:hypothetical protein